MAFLLKLENEEELRHAKDELFAPGKETGWVLIDYSSADQVKFVANGHGDIEELKPHLRDDAIQYAKIRLGGITEKGALKPTVRDVFILYVGKDVSLLEKGRKAEFLNRAEFFLQPFHAEVTVTNKDALTTESLLDRSHPLSGSHEI